MPRQLILSADFDNNFDRAKTITILRAERDTVGHYDFHPGRILFALGPYKSYRSGELPADFRLIVDTPADHYFEEEFVLSEGKFYTASGEYICPFPTKKSKR